MNCFPRYLRRPTCSVIQFIVEWHTDRSETRLLLVNNVRRQEVNNNRTRSKADSVARAVREASRSRHSLKNQNTAMTDEGVFPQSCRLSGSFFFYFFLFPEMFVTPQVSSICAGICLCRLLIAFLFHLPLLLLLLLPPLLPKLTSSCCLGNRINSQRKCQRSGMAPKRKGPLR